MVYKISGNNPTWWENTSFKNNVAYIAKIDFANRIKSSICIYTSPYWNAYITHSVHLQRFGINV